MPKRRRVFSGAFVVSVLVKKFDFGVVSQKGSHIKLRCGSCVTVVPLHKELAPGTLSGVLRLAKIEKEDFLRAIEK